MARPIVFLLFLLPLVACARALATPTPPPVVSPLRVLDTQAQGVIWARDGTLLVYNKRARDGVLDIWTSRPDGSAKRCLTCGPNFPRRHRVAMALRPQNDFIVFVAANADARDFSFTSLVHPSQMIHANIWSIRIDGSQMWKLTDWPTDARAPRALGPPQFSRDGTRLAWTESLGKTDSSRPFAWGEWAIAVADFVIENPTPRLRNIARTQIGDQHAFIALHDWALDDRTLLLAGNLGRGQPVTGLDLFEYTFTTGELNQLTHSREQWDANARYVHDGQAIVWASSLEMHVMLDARAWQNDLRSDLWRMERGDAKQQRVTFFNQPGTADYEWFQKNIARTDRVVVADSAFSPAGKQLALTLAYPNMTGALETVLVLLDMARAPFYVGPPTTSVPREYQARYAELAQLLAAWTSQLDSASRHTTSSIFAAELVPADSVHGEELLTDYAFQKAMTYLDALHALGARGVQVSIRYPLLALESPRAREYSVFYQRLAREIRRRRMVLLINTSIAQADPRVSSLEKYKQVKREHVAAILREIQPDYLTIAHEPGAEAQITGLPITPASFSEHIQFILGLIDRRDTLIGIGLGVADDPAYLQGFAKNPSVDYIDIRVNRVDDAAIARLQQLYAIAQTNRQRVLISQAWLAKHSTHEAFAFWQPLDVQFLNALAQFARQNSVTLVSFARPNYFFAYLDYATVTPDLTAQNLDQLANLAALEHIRANQINATGLAFQKHATGK